MTRGMRLELQVPAEVAILAAILEVEKLPADTKLAGAVMLLMRAKERVSNYVDGLRGHAEPQSAPPAAPEPAPQPIAPTAQFAPSPATWQIGRDEPETMSAGSHVEGLRGVKRAV